MIVINDEEYLNLQEQVWRNAETIRCLLSGLKITGTGPTLPPDPENQDAFLLQQDGKTYLSIYFEADQAWANLGEFPAVGPQGIPGPQGSAATIGAVECSTRTISAGDSASVEVSVAGTNLHFDFEIPQGAVGAQGPRGERGPQGLTGETGPRGPQGETGSSISIAGTLTSSSNLPDPETVPATTAYLVGLTAPYNLYVIVGAAGSRLWKDVGAVTPQNITVDASMSGTSQNPVQNRVVKSYVDAVKTTAEAAYTRSGSNLSRINAIQNVDLPNIYYELADLKEIVFETVAAVAAYVVDPAAFFVTPSYITIEGVAYPVIDDTDAEVAEILGSTVVWNQHVRNGNFASEDDWTAESSTFSVSSNAATFTASSQYGSIKQTVYGLKGGHKYALFAMVRTTTATDSVAINLFRNLSHEVFTAASTGWQAMKSLIEIETDGNGTLYVTDNRAADWDAVYVRSVVIVDVTAAIPTNTPTSVDDDRVQRLIRYALANPAYAENALLDFRIDSITSRGFNQWNEAWMANNLFAGVSGSSDPINIDPANPIYFDTPSPYYIGSYQVFVQFLDAANNVLGTLQTWSPIVTPDKIPESAASIKFGLVNDVYGTTYHDDICVNVSNASLNGQYKPYREGEIDWESIIPDDEDRTARSAGSVRDVIYVRDDGNDTFSIVKNKKIGVVDLGTRTWLYDGGNNIFVAQIPGMKANPYTSDAVLCSAYPTKPLKLADFPDDAIRYGDGSNYIYVRDNSYPDAVAFKSAMSGVLLAYELATPEETVLASGLLYDHVSFLIERGGTIAINGGMPDALPGVEIDIPVKRFNE